MPHLTTTKDWARPLLTGHAKAVHVKCNRSAIDTVRQKGQRITGAVLVRVGAALDIHGQRADTEIALAKCPWLPAAATMAAILTVALLAITILSSAEPPQPSANFTWLGSMTPTAEVQGAQSEAGAMVAQGEPSQAKLQP